MSTLARHCDLLTMRRSPEMFVQPHKPVSKFYLPNSPRIFGPGRIRKPIILLWVISVRVLAWKFPQDKSLICSEADFLKTLRFVTESFQTTFCKIQCRFGKILSRWRRVCSSDRIDATISDSSARDTSHNGLITRLIGTSLQGEFH